MLQGSVNARKKGCCFAVHVVVLVVMGKAALHMRPSRPNLCRWRAHDQLDRNEPIGFANAIAKMETEKD